MSDLHSINEAINKRAGRKLLPSIGVGLFLIALVWLSLSTYRFVFAIVVAIAVVLGIRELNRALSAADIHLPLWALTAAGIELSGATWLGGVSGLAVATAIALPCLTRLWSITTVPTQRSHNLLQFKFLNHVWRLFRPSIRAQ